MNDDFLNYFNNIKNSIDNKLNLLKNNLLENLKKYEIIKLYKIDEKTNKLNLFKIITRKAYLILDSNKFEIGYIYNNKEDEKYAEIWDKGNLLIKPNFQSNNIKNIIENTINENF